MAGEVFCRCSQCGKVFTVAMSDMRKLGTCPVCKREIEYVPLPKEAQGTTVPSSPPAIPINVPRRISMCLFPDEHICYASNPSQGALILGMLFWGVVWAIVGGIASLTVIGALIMFMLALLFTYLSWKHRFYAITDRRTIVTQGIFNVALQMAPNRNIQMISVNTGIIDSLLGLNSVEVSTAAQGGSVLSVFPGISRGNIQMKWVSNLQDILKQYGGVFGQTP